MPCRFFSGDVAPRRPELPARPLSRTARERSLGPKRAAPKTPISRRDRGLFEDARAGAKSRAVGNDAGGRASRSVTGPAFHSTPTPHAFATQRASAVLPQPSGASLRKASMLAKTSVPDVRMPKYEHNARQLSSRFVTDTSHAQSYNRKRELYRGVKRSSSYSSYIPRSKSDDDDDTQLSSGPTRERLSLL